MVGFKHTLSVLMLLTVGGFAVAQNNTNSPYTRYGYGELSSPNFGNSRAMGGIAYGLRDGFQINPQNPASYTAVDSLTFLFEGGASFQNDNMSDGVTKLNVKNSSFDYLAMQFRMHRNLSVSIGVLPFSNIGYNVTQVYSETSTTPNYAKQVYGDGGLHQVYGGVGIKVLKNLSVGANVSFLWGEMNRSLTMIYPSYTTSTGSGTSTPSYTEASYTSVKSYKVDLGIQYSQPIAEKHLVTLGAVFSPGHNLNNESYTQTTTTVVNTQDTIAKFGIPTSYGVGFTYKYDNRLTIGADYSFEEWSKVTYMNTPNAFCNRTKISAGAEFIPSLMSRNYLGLIKYRVGGYYQTPYYKAENGERASKEWGVSAGFGLPLPRSRSLISVTAQYIHVKGLQPAMLTENILKLSIGITFNERWFFKRKVD